MALLIIATFSWCSKHPWSYLPSLFTLLIGNFCRYTSYEILLSVFPCTPPYLLQSSFTLKSRIQLFDILVTKSTMDMGHCRIEKVENFYYGVPERREEVAGGNKDRLSRRRSTSVSRAPQQPSPDHSQRHVRHTLQSRPGQIREHTLSSYISPFDDRYAVDHDEYASEDEESSDESCVSASEGRAGRRNDPPYPHTAHTTNFGQGERERRDRVAMPEPRYQHGLSPRPPPPLAPFHSRPQSSTTLQQRRPNIPYDRPSPTAPRSRNPAASDAYLHGYATNSVPDGDKSRRADTEPATWQPHRTGYQRSAGEGFASSANPRPSAHGQRSSSSYQPPLLNSMPFHTRPTSMVFPEQQRTAAAAAPRDTFPRPRGERDDINGARGTKAQEESPTRNAYRASGGRQGREGEERRVSATVSNTSSRRQPHSSSRIAAQQSPEREERQQRQRRGSAAVAPATREWRPSERVVRFAAGTSRPGSSRTNTSHPSREVDAGVNGDSGPRARADDVVVREYSGQRTTTGLSGVEPPAYRREAEVVTGSDNNNNNDDNNNNGRTGSGRVYHDGDKKKNKYKGRNIAWLWFLGTEVVPDKKGKKKKGRW